MRYKRKEFRGYGFGIKQVRCVQCSILVIKVIVTQFGFGSVDLVAFLLLNFTYCGVCDFDILVILHVFLTRRMAFNNVVFNHLLLDVGRP